MAYNDKIKRIEYLLDKYYEATTSVEEESELRDFFLNNEVPAHLEYDQLQFQFYNEENEVKTENALNKLEFSETETKKKRSVLRFINYAAAAVLLISVGWFSNNKYQQHLEEEKEMMIAYQETQKALLMLSANFNKGVEKASSLKEMNKAQTEIINKDY